MDYVITIIYNKQQEFVKSEKRFTDKEHLEVCIESAKRDARVQEETFGYSYEIYQNKCYICCNGYLYTGDYVARIK